VHTHPGSAFHSSRDNGLALVQTSGFRSLVIPNFAEGPVTLRETFLAERTPDGHWRELNPTTDIEVVQ
jgi:hypothetical protein